MGVACATDCWWVLSKVKYVPEEEVDKHPEAKSWMLTYKDVDAEENTELCDARHSAY